MIHVSLKRSIVVATVIVALLLTLLAGFIRADMTRQAWPGYGVHSSHPVAMYCPPPPILC
jgi:hypothetical protein